MIFLMVVGIFIAWYIIGFALHIVLTKIDEGEYLVGDISSSSFFAIFGPFLLFVLMIEGAGWAFKKLETKLGGWDKRLF